MRYYVKDSNEAIFRRVDGLPLRDAPPDEVLHWNGWAPVAGAATVSADARPAPSVRGSVGGPDPTLLDRLVEIDEDEARRVAEAKTLPSDW